MNNILLKATGVALLGGALFALSNTTALAGIANTKHNLGTSPSTATRNNYLSAGTAEICVFCHTPHGADTAAVVPLWNRALEANPEAVYTTYDTLGTSGLDGAVAAVGSVSIACLSCHDGQQAMDAVINAPGSGGFNAGGAVIPGGVWVGSQFLNDPTAITSIGVDLQNDHPVGIQYGGGGISTVNHIADAAGSLAPDALNDKDFVLPYGKLINANTVWWVDVATFTGGTGTAGVREKTDMQLYTRGGLNNDLGAGWTGATDPQPFVECASCHDPHLEDTGNNPTFLRVSNDGSAVCLACHVK